MHKSKDHLLERNAGSTPEHKQTNSKKSYIAGFKQQKEMWWDIFFI
jgi:hypothetical protein